MENLKSILPPRLDGARAAAQECRKMITSRLRRKTVRLHLEPFMAAHATAELVLDLGCGNSRYTNHFPNRIGLDVRGGIGVAVVGDAHGLPFATSSLAVVVSSEMLEHVTDPQMVVDEIARVLKPGGKVILTTRFVFPIHDAPNDYYRFTQYGLKYLFRNWNSVDVRPDTKAFEGIAVLFQRLAYQSDFRGSKATTLLCLLAAKVVAVCDVLIRRQYGDYKRTFVDDHIISSGYHLVATR